MNDHLIMIAVGTITGIGGMIIGYYKSEANLAKNYISKKDCIGCVVRSNIAELSKAVTQAAKDLKEGSKTFTDLRIDMALIKQRLEIKEDKVTRDMLRERIENGEES